MLLFLLVCLPALPVHGQDPVLLDQNERTLSLDFSEGEFHQVESSSGALRLALDGSTYFNSGHWTSPVYDTQLDHALWDWLHAEVDYANQLVNLLSNGDFETGTDGWFISGGLTPPYLDPTNSSTGSTSLRLNPDDTVLFNAAYAGNATAIPIDPEKPAHLLFDLEYDTDESPLNLQVNPQPAGGWRTLARYVFPFDDFTEQNVTLDFDQFSPSPAYEELSFRFIFEYHLDDHDKTAWVDNVRLYQDSPVGFEVRSSSNGQDWNPWVGPRSLVSRRTAPGAEPGRFIQFRVHLGTGDPNATPAVNDLRLDYTKAFEFQMPRDYPGPSVIDPPTQPAVLRVQLTDDGEGNFKLEDGTPIRFWATQIGDQVPGYMDAAEAEAYCRRLSQLGFNLVKMSPGDSAAFDRFIDSCKNAGLYIYLQLNGCGLGGGLEQLLESHWPVCKSHMQSVMDRVNSVSGIAYKDDPAIAFVQLLNEKQIHSLWRIDASELYTGPDAGEYDSRWLTWIAERYPMRGQLLAAWDDGTGVALDEGEDITNVARVRFSDWMIYSDARFADTTRYYSYLYQRFYEEFVSFLKSEVGVFSLIIGNNHYYGLSELKERLVTDVIDQHSYFENLTTLPVSGEMVLQIPQVKSPFDNTVTYTALNDILGYPLTISESNFAMPNVYTAELPLFASAYASFHDWDMYLLFIHAFWNHWGASPPQSIPMAPKETLFNPVLMAQMPAASRIFRRAAVQPALTTIELFHSEGLVSDFKHHRRDSNWNVPGLSNAFALIHRVRRADFDAPVDLTAHDYYASHSLVDPVSPYVSDTGELSLDSAAGRLTIDAPAAQGCVGFSGAEPVELTDVRFDIEPSATGFSAISFVPLDDSPIAASRHLLLTAVGRYENSKTRWNPEKTGLVNPGYHYSRDHWGEAPVLLEGIDADVTLDSILVNPRLHRLTAAGQRDQQLHVVSQDGSHRFEISEEHETLWYELLLDPPAQPTGLPGRVPDGGAVPGTPLMVRRNTPAPGDLTLEWSPSCSGEPTDFAVYRGTLGSWGSHVPVTCSTLGATTWSFAPDPDEDAYYLIVPLLLGMEGSYGTDSNGVERSYSTEACSFQQVLDACP